MAANIPTLPPLPASIGVGLSEPSKAAAAGQGPRSIALPSAGGQFQNLKTLGRRGGSGEAKSAAKYTVTPEPSTGQARRDGRAEPFRQPPPLPPAGTSGNGAHLTREPSFSEWITRSVARVVPDQDDWAKLDDILSARYAALKGLAGEMEQLLQQSEINTLGAAPQDKLRNYEKAIRADWAAFQTQRLHPQAQRLLSAIQAELSSLQSELARLSKQLR